VQTEVGTEIRPEIGSHPSWPLVLYFHHVRSDIDHYTVLSPGEFSLALDLLERWFQPLDPRRLGEPAAARAPEPSCLLSFDDGYLDVWEQAVPAMEERGLRAAMFVSTGQVGTVEQHPRRGSLEHMTWSQLRELDARGHLIANHGHSHRDMSLLKPESVRSEVAVGQACLDREVGPRPAPLAYPYGNQPDGLEELEDALPPLCFGSVKAPAAPWTDSPQLIRRTFLPSGATERWPAIVEGWRRQWESLA
jgi:peptidoglycan/xylan/chitin deacetylase (PgdA/CDA1 family)